MNKKDASIKLISRQYDGENDESTELFSSALYEKTESGYCISYEESDATGFNGSVTRLETFGDKKVIMNRAGEVTSNLIIEPDTKHHCVYQTPFGSFMLGVSAKDIHSALDDNGGKLDFHYVLDVNSSYLGDYKISVEVTV